MNKAIERFKRYIAIDTKADPKNETQVPSSPGQFNLANLLYQELKDIGMEDVYQDEHAYVYAKLSANTGDQEKKAAIAFISHMDTAPDLDGRCINPQIVDYQGGDIILNSEYKISGKDFPVLQDLKGKTLMTTDGTTLLGADDKAGITIIMEAMVYLKAHPEIKHGDITVCFVPDEEIGHQVALLDFKRLGSDFAYTVDGGELGGIEYENFNAASVTLEIKGKNVHPGSAKNIMRNAMEIAMEFNHLLPAAERPEYTEGYEGFYHLIEMAGTVEFSNLTYIIRDHDQENFLKRKAYFLQCVEFLNQKYGEQVIDLTIKDSYYNMKEIIAKDMRAVDLCLLAMQELEIEPKIMPIRGGTDGANISYKGLPCPNIFDGGYNFHGRYEFLDIDAMLQGIKLLVKIIELS